MLKKISLSTMASIYFFAGFFHFLKADYFIKLMPPFIPAPPVFTALVGSYYILTALLLVFPKTRRAACYGIILVLAIGLPVNLYLLSHPVLAGPIPHDVLLERIPFKMFLMVWAWWHSRMGKADGRSKTTGI